MKCRVQQEIQHDSITVRVAWWQLTAVPMLLEGLDLTEQFIWYYSCQFCYLYNNKPRREIVQKADAAELSKLIWYTASYTLNLQMRFEGLIFIIYFQAAAYLNVVFFLSLLRWMGGILYLIPLTLYCCSIFGALSISAVAWLSFSSSASVLLDRTWQLH